MPGAPYIPDMEGTSSQGPAQGMRSPTATPTTSPTTSPRSRPSNARPSNARRMSLVQDRLRERLGSRGPLNNIEREITRVCIPGLQTHMMDGRYCSWISGQNLLNTGEFITVFLGQYNTEYLAIRAADRAAIKFGLSRDIIPLTYPEEDYAEDQENRETLSDPDFVRMLIREGSEEDPEYTSPMFRKFLADEAARREEAR